MSCSIVIEDRPKFLYVTVTGDNTPQTLRTCTTEIPQACIKHQKSRVLVVARLRGSELTMLEVYKGVASGSDNAVGLGVRVAYVDEDQSRDADSMLLAEDVAHSRGVAVRTFREVQEAERWLISDQGF